MFEQRIIELPPLDESTSSSGRFYVTPDGKAYPSVTTVLKEMSDQSHLEKWRDRVGHDKAEHISKQATERGSLLHAHMESYLKNISVNLVEMMPNDAQIYSQIVRLIGDRVSAVYATEFPLYSDNLKIAGRCDALVVFDGHLAIMDFKTSRSYKRIEWIQNYIFQCCIYAYMLHERTGMVASKLIIPIARTDDVDGQLFVEDINKYVRPAVELVRNYHRRMNNGTVSALSDAP